MVSSEYRDNIYKTQRITYPEVIYSLTALNSKHAGKLNLAKSNGFSRDSQIINEVRNIEYKIATCEPNYWKLDGTFILPPKPEDEPIDGLEIGYWSDAQSNHNALFSNENGNGYGTGGYGEDRYGFGLEVPEPIILEREFPQVQSFTSLGIAFDQATNNYCTEFEVFFYAIDNSLIHHEYIIDNDLYYVNTEKAGYNIFRVVIKLYKTNNPFRYVRSGELDFGIHLEFDDTDIKSITLINESDYLGKRFILPEFRMTILNRKRFDILDLESYAHFMQTRQKFEYNHGLLLPDGSIEYVFCGHYYLKDWTVSDLTVSFTATGKYNELENTMFFESSFERINIINFVRKLFPDAKIDLTSPQFPAYLGTVNYRKALTILIELSCCLAFENRSNVIQFEDIISKYDRDSSINGYGAGGYGMGGYGIGEQTIIEEIFDVINYDNIIRRIPNVKMAEYYNGINLMEYIYLGNNEQGEPIFEKEQIFYPAPWNLGAEPDQPYEIDLPMMIRTTGYEIFRDWFLNRKFSILLKRINSDINWVQNPAQLVGDIIGSQLNANPNVVYSIATKQELNYPALKGSTKIIRELEHREYVPQQPQILFAFNQPPRKENTRYAMLRNEYIKSTDFIFR